MTPDVSGPLWRTVFRTLGDWERAGHPGGSARPLFDATWRANAPRDATIADRESCWKHWLEAGGPPTRDLRAELFQRLTLAFSHPAFREPGEEG